VALEVDENEQNEHEVSRGEIWWEMRKVSKVRNGRTSRMEGDQKTTKTPPLNVPKKRRKRKKGRREVGRITSRSFGVPETEEFLQKGKKGLKATGENRPSSGTKTLL